MSCVCFLRGVSASTAAAAAAHMRASAAAAAWRQRPKQQRRAASFSRAFPSFQSPTLLQGIFARSPPHIAPLIAFATDPDTIYLTIFPRIYPLTPCAPPGRWCLASPLSLIQSMINGRTADRSPLSPLRLRRSDGKSARTTTTAVLSIGL